MKHLQLRPGGTLNLVAMKQSITTDNANALLQELKSHIETTCPDLSQDQQADQALMAWHAISLGLPVEMDYRKKDAMFRAVFGQSAISRWVKRIK